MRELRAITDALRGVFEAEGYGEVWTPTLEYEEVLQSAGIGAEPAYRVFDDHGEVLALRSDMTVPIARLVATRYAGAEPPLRFHYAAHAYRAVRPHRGQMREVLQAGIELVGAPPPHGTAQGPRVAWRARAGARRHRRGAARDVPGAGRRRSAGLPDRPGRRFAVPGAAGRARGLRGGGGRRAQGARDPRLRRARARGSRAGPRRRRCRSPPARAAAARRLRGPRPGSRRCGRRLARPTGAARADGGRPGDLRPRPLARPRLLHGR